jgi:uncharacterized membrane protein
MSAASAAPSRQRSGAERTRGLTGAIAALAALGAGIAGYLTYVHYAGIDPICTGGGSGCHTVQSSSYAELASIPVAVLGLAGYLAILGSLFVRGERGATATAVLALVGFGFSAYLTYLELFEIDAICQWCVASAIVMTLLAVLGVTRLLRFE